MNRNSLCALAGVAALGFLAGAVAFGPAHATPQDHPRGGDHPQPPQGQDMQLPPGWTMEDMMAYAEAGTPGEEHAFLAKGVGEWTAKTTMWMAPDSDPIVSEGDRVTTTPLMDGRYVKVDMQGEMPGMGPYHGMGIYGYNNVTEEFESIWIDNHSTGMMRGTGQLQDDGTTLVWEYNYACPIRDKTCTMREIERVTGENTKVLEMHGEDPKSGVEYKMMEIEFTRRGTARAR